MARFFDTYTILQLTLSTLGLFGERYNYPCQSIIRFPADVVLDICATASLGHILTGLT